MNARLKLEEEFEIDLLLRDNYITREIFLQTCFYHQ